MWRVRFPIYAMATSLHCQILKAVADFTKGGLTRLIHICGSERYQLIYSRTRVFPHILIYKDHCRLLEPRMVLSIYRNHLSLCNLVIHDYQVTLPLLTRDLHLRTPKRQTPLHRIIHATLTIPASTRSTSSSPRIPRKSVHSQFTKFYQSCSKILSRPQWYMKQCYINELK